MGKMRSTHRNRGFVGRLRFSINDENRFRTTISDQGEVKDKEATNIKDELAALVLNKLKHAVPRSNMTSIFKVPRALRKVNEEAYTPQVVSIGPYHRGSEKLQIMEETKLLYLSNLLGRGPYSIYDEPKRNGEVEHLEWLIKNLRKLEEQARQCYGHTVKEDTNTFVEMMLLDGCFIIELFFKYMERREDVVACDPLFHISSMMTAIRVDMLLLENQLPFFILEQLFILSTGDNEKFLGASFLEVTLQFFNFKYLLNVAQDCPQSADIYHIKHFLDLLRHCCLPAKIRPQKNRECKFIPGATELHDAGISLKKATGNCMFDIKFTKGTFEIPTLIVEDTTEILFRNLIAWEQCSEVSHKQYITHYLALMDFLINSQNDVATLRRFGIIDNWLGDNEQVCLLFNKIFVGVTMFAKSFYFYQLAEDVNVYYKSPWHSFRAMLDREYFYSPWSTASTIAVIIVLLCTITQTVCTVISTTK